ncbi:hypothetical protein NIES2100_05230 [Calothrix sp. NIES-2100]|uniref:hypothetical protein n=1 Tax=Calothrix sp. NIES-2100 TaxID=1954172 RepID=UPI000B607475|nr:hypothetical protein NIES2100_05230 [Calothrix sp. NIES-2100]
MATTDVLNQLADQIVALASLVRQLIATKADDSNKIAQLTDQALQKDTQIQELLSSDQVSSEKAVQLSNEIKALVTEATAALAQPA